MRRHKMNPGSDFLKYPDTLSKKSEVENKEVELHDKQLSSQTTLTFSSPFTSPRRGAL